uniref:Nonaspanin n=1 Tax=Tanacetum cinerariifolium TaxID=118510 RepID=A0A699J420_TANCI|nr:nonaspanin [Tanacetum cinerariifolium]
MQEGLSAGITHGAKGRKLADVAAYNPSAKADYLIEYIPFTVYPLIALLMVTANESNRSIGFDNPVRGMNPRLSLYFLVRDMNWRFLLSGFKRRLLRAAISKAAEKGMQEGLSAGITHGAEGRQLADVAAYNPSAEADYLSALQHLQNVNFPLIAELKSNKDASVDTIMNLLRLDDVLAERLGLTESQPYVNQLMVPIHHSPDQCVVGASALSLSLEVSHSRVKKMRENIAKHVSVLRGVFVPLSEPLSAADLKGMEGPSGSTPDATTTLSTTFISASTIPPISTDDYEVAHEDGQGVPV